TDPTPHLDRAVLVDLAGDRGLAALHDGGQGHPRGPLVRGGAAGTGGRTARRAHEAGRSAPAVGSPRRIASAVATSSAAGRSRPARSDKVQHSRSVLSTPRGL